VESKAAAKSPPEIPESLPEPEVPPPPPTVIVYVLPVFKTIGSPEDSGESKEILAPPAPPPAA
jgi:hypothetical protein